MTARIPAEDLPKDVKLSAGDNVSLSNGTNAVVRESTAESVLLDFNHPMAGKALTFEVELLKLTKVSGLVPHDLFHANSCCCAAKTALHYASGCI